MTNISKINKKSFVYWDNNTMVSWICEQGLGKYVRDCKRYLTKGYVLTKCSINDLENVISVYPLNLNTTIDV